MELLKATLPLAVLLLAQPLQNCALPTPDHTQLRRIESILQCQNLY